MRMAHVVYWISAVSEVKMPATAPGNSIINSQNTQV